MDFSGVAVSAVSGPSLPPTMTLVGAGLSGEIGAFSFRRGVCESGHSNPGYFTTGRKVAFDGAQRPTPLKKRACQKTGLQATTKSPT